MLPSANSRFIHDGILLAFLLAFLFANCKAYNHTAVNPGNTVKQVRYYVADEVFSSNFAWRIDASAVDQSAIRGTLLQLSKEDAQKIAKGRPQKIGDDQPMQMVVFFVKNEYSQTLFDSVKITLPFSKVTRCEVYEYSPGKTATNRTLITLGTITATALILGVACSCPSVYAISPDGVAYEGDLYSGSAHPGLERHDWLPLSPLRPDGDHYQLRMVNEDPEIQYINEVDLIAVDHPAGVTVLYDKYGRLHTLSQPESPVLATDLEGRDVRPAVLYEDNDPFQGSPGNTNPRAEDGLLLSFRRPAGATQARLLVRANTSSWLGYSHTMMQQEFGEYGPKMRRKFLEKDSAEVQKWVMRQNIPLSVWMETAPGKWEKADFFQIISSRTPKRDVLQLDLSKIKGEQVRLKLSTGFRFWEIDYVALDFSSEQQVQTRTLPLASATDQDGKDLKELLRADDKQYYVQSRSGDAAILRFEVSTAAAGKERSLLLHAKGYYQVLREPVEGKPSVWYLRSFNRPDALPKYARDRWNEWNQRQAFQQNE